MDHPGLERAHSFSSSYESSASGGHLILSIQLPNQTPDPEVQQPPISREVRKQGGSEPELVKNAYIAEISPIGIANATLLKIRTAIYADEHGIL